MFLKPFKLKNIINGTDDVNSTVLIEDGERKIILFSLNKDAKIEEHYSPVDAAIYVLDGEINLTCDECVYKIDKEEMFMIPLNKKHSVKAEKNSQFLVIRI